MWRGHTAPLPFRHSENQTTTWYALIRMMCAGQLAGVFQHLFNLFLRLMKVPSQWKTFCIVPVQKKGRGTHITCQKDIWEAGPMPSEGPADCFPGLAAVCMPIKHWSGGCRHLPDPQALSRLEKQGSTARVVLWFLQCFQHHPALPSKG